SGGATVVSLTGEKQPKQVIAVILPENVSRHNTPTRKEMAHLKIKEAISGDDPLIVFGLDDPSHYPAMVHAVCRHLLPARQKGEKTNKKIIHIVALNRQGKVVAPTIEAKAAAKTIPWVCDVVDRPPSDITPESYALAIK